MGDDVVFARSQLKRSIVFWLIALVGFLIALVADLLGADRVMGLIGFWTCAFGVAGGILLVVGGQIFILLRRLFYYLRNMRG